MIKVYLSGKITGNPNYKKDFELAEYIVNEPCNIIINPTKEVPFNPNWTWSDYMKADLKLLADCDAIYMIKGWRRSKGARLERYVAKKLGLLIVYER